MHKQILAILLLWVASATTAFSQSLVSVLKTADIAFENQNYYGAARLYQDALKFDNRMYDVHYKAAEAFRADNDYMNAIAHYKLVSEKAAKKFPRSVFFLAAMLKSNEDYFSAQFYFDKYYRAHQADSLNYYTRKAKQEIVFCEKAISLKYNHTGIAIYPFDTLVNSLYSEFGATFISDSVLLFTSVKPTEESGNEEFTSVIYSSVFTDLQTGIPHALGSEINAPGYHNAGPFYCAEAQTLFFTRKATNPDAKAQIMSASYINGQFLNVHALPFPVNDSTCNNTQPMLVQFGNETLLFFASDREGGLGGYDIWYCSLDENLGPGELYNAGVPTEVDNVYVAFFGLKSIVNSPGNEICPFFNLKDSVLYFSSDWFEGLGAFDIYASKTDLVKWDAPQNLGYPTNSGQNDLYYSLHHKQGLAFLTSNRKEARALKHQSCCNDLFFHEIDKEIDIELIVEQQVTTLTLEATELIPITLYFDNDYPNPNSWDTLTQHNYVDLYNDYFLKRKTFAAEFSKGYRGEVKTQLEDSIENFFDHQVTGEYQKLLKFAALLKELVTKDQVIVITIKGFTSPLNTTEYNENLAKRRISSLVNFFRTYDNGFFVPFEEEGKILIQRVAFGETLANTAVSDDPNDRRNSVFSPLASVERKIRIIAVSVNKDD